MSLLPPNSTALERNAEKAISQTTELPIAIGTLWDPNTCPEHCLPWLAWALGVHAWKSYWPLDIRRNVLRNAIETKRRAGTAHAVRTVVDAFGSGVALREGHQNPSPTAPHSFDVVLSTAGAITEQLQQDIIDEISRVKPARSYFTVSASIATHTSVGVFAVARAAIYHRLDLSE